MNLRPLVPSDFGSAAQLLNEAQAEEHEFVPFTARRLAEQWAQLHTGWMLHSDDGSLAGLAALVHRWYGDEVTLAVREGSAASEQQAQLLDRIEADAAGMEIMLSVDARASQWLGWLEARGYHHRGGLLHLVAPLTQPIAEMPIPQGYQARTLRPDEVSAFTELVNGVYQGERLDRSEVEQWHAEHPEFDESWVQVAESEGRLVAAVVARPDRKFNEAFGERRGNLGPAATGPDHGGRGLGRALTARAMADLCARGFTAASLHTTEANRSARALTRDLGFELRCHWHFMTKRVGH